MLRWGRSLPHGLALFEEHSKSLIVSLNYVQVVWMLLEQSHNNTVKQHCKLYVPLNFLVKGKINGTKCLQFYYGATLSSLFFLLTQMIWNSIARVRNTKPTSQISTWPGPFLALVAVSGSKEMQQVPCRTIQPACRVSINNK